MTTTAKDPDRRCRDCGWPLTRCAALVAASAIVPKRLRRLLGEACCEECQVGHPALDVVP